MRHIPLTNNEEYHGRLNPRRRALSCAAEVLTKTTLEEDPHSHNTSRTGIAVSGNNGPRSIDEIMAKWHGLRAGEVDEDGNESEEEMSGALDGKNRILEDTGERYTDDRRTIKF